MKKSMKNKEDKEVKMNNKDVTWIIVLTILLSAFAIYALDMYVGIISF